MTQPSTPINKAGVTGALACAAVFAMTLGLTYPLLAFRLDTLGFDETEIGISAAMTPLGVLLMSPLCPVLAKRVGAWQAVAVSMILAGVLLGLLGLTTSYATFLILRFVLGAADAVVVVLSETWINQLAGKAIRGRIIGIYMTVLSAGFAFGPLVLSVTGVEGFLPFAIGMLVTLIASVIVLTTRNHLPAAAPEQGGSSWSFFALAPTLIMAVAAVAFWDAALLSLYPLYGLEQGHGTGFITFAIALCALGNTLLQVPIGWFADKTSSRTSLTVCGLVAFILTFALAASAQQAVIHLVVLFFWGAAIGGLYTMAMVELGHRFEGAQLMAGTAAFSIAFGLGGFLGGPITGGAMSLVGPSGFPISLGVVLFATVLLAISRKAATS